MSLKSDNSKHLNQNKIASPPAVSALSEALKSVQQPANKADVSARKLAKRLDEDQTIFYWYATLDSLSSSYSMYKYCIDLFGQNNDPDAMHDILMTPGGIIIAILEALFLSTYAILAAKFDNEKEDNYKKKIASSFPYFRDLIKALKNAYKGWRSCVFATNILASVDINYLIAPIGFLLGTLAAVNRLWLRRMVESRKEKMVFNVELRKKIRELPFSEDKAREYLSQIKYQSVKNRAFAYTAASANGLVDGLYLYAGVLGITALAPAAFMTMVIISTIYTAACIVNRLYEEYEFQMRLLITQTKCTFEIIAQQVKFAYSRLLALQKLEEKDEAILAEINFLKIRLSNLLDEFSKNRELQKKQSNRTYWIAILFGLKNGLYAYNALSSIIFFFVAVFLIAGCTIPPTILFTIVGVGLVTTLFFIIHSVVAHYYHLQEDSKKSNEPYKQLVLLKEDLKNEGDLHLLSKKAFNKSIEDSMSVDASPIYFFQEWFEVLRSLFSGFGKGQKFVGFACNPLQEANAEGHYHDSFLMKVLGVGGGLLFSGALGLRALAKGLGRTPLWAEDKSKTLKASPSPQTSTTATSSRPKPDNSKITPSQNLPPPLSEPIKTKNSFNYFRGGFFDKRDTKDYSASEENLAFSTASLSM